MLTPLKKTKKETKVISSAFQLIAEIRTYVEEQRHRQLPVCIVLHKPVQVWATGAPKPTNTALS